MDEHSEALGDSGSDRGSRRKARAAALRLLYSRELRRASGDFTRDDEATLADLLDVRPDDPQQPYIRRMVRMVEMSTSELDRHISPLLRGWSMDRLTRVDRLILRFGAYEILREPTDEADDPRSVAISSAIDMARIYSTPEAMTFINGVLSGLKRDI
ncbi:MAG: transcription antitermination factor NusB [Oscillospiraceae bacterium]|jgi:N utilization substance protein B|nr:transcription antitermination factor NusB [Oscillospiraceae bacterium]